MKAIKNDQNKLRMDLLPPDALEEIARVFTYGAKQYGENNWSNGFEWHRIYGATLRHLNAFWKGNNFDEVGNLHLACAGCNILMLISHYLRQVGIDDRPYSNNKTTIKDNTELENAVDEVNNFPDIRKLNSEYLDKDSKYDPDEPVLPKPDLNPELIEAKMRELLEQNKSNFNNISSEQEQSEEVEEDNNESEDTINNDNVKKTTYEKFKFNKREYMAIINHYTKPYKDFRIGYYVTIVDIKTKKVVHSFYSSKKLKKNTCMFELQKFVNEYVYRNCLYSIDDFNMDLDYNDNIGLEEYNNEQVVEEVSSKYNNDNQTDIKEKNEEKAVHLTDSIEFDSWDKIRNIKLPIHVDIIYTRKNKQERYDYIYIDKNTDKVLIQTYSDSKRSKQEIIDYYNCITNLHLHPANNIGNNNNEEFNLVNKTNVIKENTVNILPIYSEDKKKEITFFITYTNHNNIRTYTVESNYLPGTILKYRLTYDLTIDQLIINIKKSFRI